MRSRRRGGYAGLISLLITAAIIALLFWRSDLFTGGAGSSTSTPASSIQQDLNAIQDAKNAQKQLEATTTTGAPAP